MPRSVEPRLNSSVNTLFQAVGLGLAVWWTSWPPVVLADAPAAATTPATNESVAPPPGTLASQGYHLFLLNCAHCHGTDARGDEGPDLHGIVKSDEHIAALIKNGKKGEMPKFGAKLTDPDISALIAFVRSLKD